LDFVSLKAFLSRSSSFPSSSASDALALFWRDLQVDATVILLSLPKKNSGEIVETECYQVVISLNLDFKSEEASSWFCTNIS
jgi:hypothetical protein